MESLHAPPDVGTPSLFDYIKRNGKRQVKKERPRNEHVLLGIPDEMMKSCKKIHTTNGPLFRLGGLYIIEDDNVKMGILHQVYKSDTNVVYAVIERLQDVTAQKADPFILQAKMKVWKKSNLFFVTSNLSQLNSVPLLHACYAEDRPTCRFKVDFVDVTEERQTVRKEKLHFQCQGRQGKIFLVNSMAFSIHPSYEL